jgi:hypothetical protein
MAIAVSETSVGRVMVPTMKQASARLALVPLFGGAGLALEMSTGRRDWRRCTRNCGTDEREARENGRKNHDREMFDLSIFKMVR